MGQFKLFPLLKDFKVRSKRHLLVMDLSFLQFYHHSYMMSHMHSPHIQILMEMSSAFISSKISTKQEKMKVAMIKLVMLHISRPLRCFVYVCVRRQPWYYGWGFNLPRGQALLDKWNQIPDSTDILLTHCPPLGKTNIITHTHTHTQGVL